MPYLPKLTQPHLTPLVAQFAQALKDAGFAGEIMGDYGVRIGYATDNSIYQQLPALLLLPQCEEDVIKTLTLLHEEVYHSLHICARGGGTGTNGQSLTDGIVMDFSRHMNHIIDIDWQNETVTVQPGVVLSELNNTLSKQGYFFAPDVSTANRATLGGMIANDSSGKGSRIYGKTSDHICSLTHVLLGGKTVTTQTADKEHTSDVLHPLFDHLDDITRTHAQLIESTYPKLDRGLTGYNLAKVRHQTSTQQQPQLNLNYIFSGAEGSLGLLTRATLKITKKPSHTRLVVITYPNFTAALKQAPVLLTTPVVAVETIDDTVASLAQHTPEWHKVRHILAPDGTSGGTFNLAECAGMTQEEVNQSVALLEDALKENDLHRSLYVTQDAQEIQALWSIRAKSVGLLGSFDEKQGDLDPKPIACIEDTAVHPDVLADYIIELRTLLDDAHLPYGMFGHIDAGCLHVRPAIDMTDAQERKKIRTLSDAVMRLVRKYKGVFWGEHGKGYRAEFSQAHFGDTLYAALVTIKQLCDPHNQLNRCKIMVAPNKNDIRLLAIDSVPTKGQKEQQVPKQIRNDFAKAFACNGNALCYNVSQADVMCPSYKITGDRLQAPKGRAALMREWLALLAERDVSVSPSVITPHPLRKLQKAKQKDISAQVYNAMQGCLACKACTTTCPVTVDIPTLKAKFLSLYHSRYARPIKDYIIASIEQIAPLLAKIPRTTNCFMNNLLVRTLLHLLGLVDMPKVSTHTVASLGKQAFFDAYTVNAMSDQQRSRVVVIVQDAFSSFFDSQAVIATYHLLVQLGYTPLLLPFHPNGKAQYVKGFLQAFAKRVHKNARWMAMLDELNLPIIGIEPSMTLTYREEYLQYNAHKKSKCILTLPEWLANEIQKGAVNRLTTNKSTANKQANYRLLPHCTERTHIPQTAQLWKDIFAFFDLPIEVSLRGCCGMAGTYGHETEHLHNSKALFKRHWSSVFANNASVMATGFSCRSQSKRMVNVRPPYPTEVLLAHLTDAINSE